MGPAFEVDFLGEPIHGAFGGGQHGVDEEAAVADEEFEGDCVLPARNGVFFFEFWEIRAVRGGAHER